MPRCKLLFVLLLLLVMPLTGCSLLSSDLFYAKQRELNQGLDRIQQLEISRESLEHALEWAFPKGYDMLMGEALEQAECEELRLTAQLSCVRQYEKPYSVYVLEREQVLRENAMLREAHEARALSELVEERAERARLLDLPPGYLD